MWVVTLGDQSVSLDDLSPQTFQRVAAQHKLTWLDLYYGPAANLDAFYDLLVECAKTAGVDPPEKPTTMRAARALLDLIDQVEEDDRPKAGTVQESLPVVEDPETT